MNRRDIEKYLLHLNEAEDGTPSDNALPEVIEATELIKKALSQTNPDRSHEHYDLLELKEMARSRRDESISWEMPVELSTCPLCLEAFEVLLEGEHKPSQATSQRYIREGKGRLHDHKSPLPSLTWFEKAASFAAAAAIIIALGVAFSLPGKKAKIGNEPQDKIGPTALDEGSFTASDGKNYAPGEDLPQDIWLTTDSQSNINFPEGSKLAVEAESSISLHVSNDGAVEVKLRKGAVFAEVTKRTDESPFAVATPLGRVQVLGTKFSVACDADEVILLNRKGYKLQADRNTGMAKRLSVRVYEGTVALETGKEDKTLISAGKAGIVEQTEKGPKVSVITPEK